MYETLNYLTQIQPPRNYKNIDSLNKVADYIKSRFENIGLEVEFQEYDVEGKVYKNVIATINPQYEKRLIIGGHYDVCGDIQGADDNASAIAGVIESARQLEQNKDELNFRIDFVAFTLEEPPHFGTKNMGSYKHAEYLFDNDINVIGMINYEMIGYFTDEPDSQNYPMEVMEDLYPSTGNFIAIVSNEDSIDFLNTLDYENIKKDIYDLLKDGKNIKTSAEVENLTQIYIDEGIIPENYENDALLIALTSVYSLDILVSWNFKHLVKRKTRIGVNLINLKNSYKTIEILAPPEL